MVDKSNSRGILKRQLLAGGFSPEGVPQGDLRENIER